MSSARCVLALAATILVTAGPLKGQRQASSLISIQPDTSHRSPAKTIVLHGAVGTGAGLLIGLLLSGASTSEDKTSVVVTWTALGAVAGVASGVITWLVSRER